MPNQSSIVSVVIVNHNGKEYLKSLLKSLEEQSYQPLEVIIVDNASRDGSLKMLKEEFPQVILIKNNDNLYFCTANNQGIDISRGEFVLCLNNDIVLDKDFIKCLIEKKDLASKIGMWGGKILRIDRKTIDTTGLFLGRSRKPVDRGYNRKDTGQFNKDEYVFGIGGAAVLFRRSMLDEIKIDGQYFDQDFDLFYEDLDLCWRAYRFGWKAYYVSNAIAYHKRGGTTQTKPPRISLLSKFYFSYLSSELQANLVKNRYLTIIKNDKLKDFIKNFIFIAGYDIKLWSYILFFRPKIILRLFKYRGIFRKSYEKRKVILDTLHKLK